MSSDAEFLRAMHIQPDLDPEPGEDTGIPESFNDGIEVRFDSDGAMMSRDDLERLLASNYAFRDAAERWCQSAKEEHDRAERYRRISIGLVIVGCLGVWFA